MFSMIEGYDGGLSIIAYIVLDDIRSHSLPFFLCNMTFPIKPLRIRRPARPISLNPKKI